MVGRVSQLTLWNNHPRYRDDQLCKDEDGDSRLHDEAPGFLALDTVELLSHPLEGVSLDGVILVVNMGNFWCGWMKTTAENGSDHVHTKALEDIPLVL